jgi:hypothetical protein
LLIGVGIKHAAQPFVRAPDHLHSLAHQPRPEALGETRCAAGHVPACDSQQGRNYLATLDDIVASRGGIPLVEDNKIVGAIDCSGATGSQDEVVCMAGAAAIK